MGFLDKMKGTAKQAMSPGAQMGERDKIQRINQAGVEARATVNSLQETGTQLGGGHQIDFELTVHPSGGEDYSVSPSQSMHDATLEGIAEGGDVTGKVNPNDSNSLMVWGPAV